MRVANDRRVILALAALTCWLALASSAAAQSMLGGVVSYPTGQVAANVDRVVAENEDTGETWNARSSSLGIYSFYHLPNGTYTIRVNYSQLSFRRRGHPSPPPSENRARHSALHLRSHHRPRHQRPPPPPLRRLLGAAFSREAIDGMSLTNGPNLQSILSAIPCINFTDSYRVRSRSTAVGQPRFSNRLSIDGISVDLAGGCSTGVRRRPGWQRHVAAPSRLHGGNADASDLPSSAIDEIQIRTTNASSEHARTPGAQVIVVTRSGSDHFKGQPFPPTLVQNDSAATDWFINAGERPESRARYWDAGTQASGADSSEAHCVSSPTGNINESTVPLGETHRLCRHSQ